jgi:hypothetical protein
LRCRLIGLSLFALAVYVSVESVRNLVSGGQPAASPVIQNGATITDRLFGSPADRRAAEAVAADSGVKSQAGLGQ